MEQLVDQRKAQFNRALRWSVLLLIGFLFITAQVLRSGPLIAWDEFNSWIFQTIIGTN